MAKRIIGKLPLAAVLVGIALSSAGCASLMDKLEGLGFKFASYKETATSQMLLAGANDILTGNPDGYPAAQFKALFLKKYPGLKWNKNTENNVQFTYKNANFSMNVDNVPQQRGNKMYYFWVSASTCKESVPREKK